MRKILSIGGKCEDCGSHVELQVASFIEVYRFHFIHFIIGFASGAIGTYIGFH